MIKYRPSRSHARKKAVYLCLITFSAACLITGCKKNKHEKIDLSSTHTTAAETMAPETSKAETTAVETTAAITLDAAVENAANANSGKTSGSGSGAASLVTSLKTTINTYASGKVSIQYPSVTMDDSEKAARINELLKKNALSSIQASGIDEATDSLQITCKVLAADRSRITVTYTGTLAPEGAAFPTNLFYSNTIDVAKVSNLGLEDFADPYTLAGYVLSGDCVFPESSEALKSDLMRAKNEQTLEYYTGLFKNADFPFDGYLPSCFSYEHEGDIYFSIPVAHALGDYAIIAYTPDTK